MELNLLIKMYLTGYKLIHKGGYYEKNIDYNYFSFADNGMYNK